MYLLFCKRLKKRGFADVREAHDADGEFHNKLESIVNKDESKFDFFKKIFKRKQLENEIAIIKEL